MDLLKHRILIIGNSGSGKSTLATAIGDLTGYPVIDLDSIHWHDAHSGQKRDETETKRMTSEIARNPVWVIEGVFGWLAEIALEHADTLVWINVPWRECLDGLNERQVVTKAPEQAYASLLDWAKDYWKRETSSSFKGHTRLFENFDGRAIELDSRRTVNLFIESLSDKLVEGQ